VITASRQKYATPRAEVEAALRENLNREEPEPPKARRAASAAPQRSEQHTPPKASEVRNEAPPAAAPPAAEPEPTATTARPPPIRELGRGGVQHQTIQRRVKEEAQKLGFGVKTEFGVLDGAGDIDLVLTREPLSLACEIAITSTIDQEVWNVSKCLKAGFKTIFVLSTSEDRLRKLKDAIRNTLGDAS